MTTLAALSKPRGGRPAAAPVRHKFKAPPARRSDLQGSDEDIDTSTLGGRLAYARLREEVTQEELAKAIDKVRGTIVAYESGKIMPPIPIVEALAKRLKVSPSFLAFGEHGVKAVPGGNAAELSVNVDEITYGRNGSGVTGTFAMPRALAESYVADLRDLKVFVLNHNAEAFSLRQGSRLFVDTSVTTVVNEFDTYAIEVPGGMEVIRVAPSYSKTAKLTVEGSRGDKQQVSAKDLTILGAVVSTLRPQ